MMIWAARLGGFLLFRVLKTGSTSIKLSRRGYCLSLLPGDTRFDEMRSHFFKFAGFWVGQILWVWTVCECISLSFLPCAACIYAMKS